MSEIRVRIDSDQRRSDVFWNNRWLGFVVLTSHISAFEFIPSSAFYNSPRSIKAEATVLTTKEATRLNVLRRMTGSHL